jgi:hypothetical protein
LTALYTFDVFSTLDGYGSYGPDGDWGGYWGKQGPEFLDRRLALYREPQRLVLGANTMRMFMGSIGPRSGFMRDVDPVNDAMRNLPTTVLSRTLEGPLDWPDATIAAGEAVDVVARLKEDSDVPCARTAACPSTARSWPPGWSTACRSRSSRSFRAAPGHARSLRGPAISTST